MRVRNNVIATLISTLILLLAIAVVIVPTCIAIVHLLPVVTLTELFLGIIAVAVVGILLGVISLW
jgi:hypothetical protein